MQILGAPTPQEAAAIHALMHTPDWKVLTEYLQRELNVQDAKLRGVSPEHLGRVQGAALILTDLLQLPDAARSVYKHT